MAHKKSRLELVGAIGLPTILVAAGLSIAALTGNLPSFDGGHATDQDPASDMPCATVAVQNADGTWSTGITADSLPEGATAIFRPNYSDTLGEPWTTEVPANTTITLRAGSLASVSAIMDTHIPDIGKQECQPALVRP